MPENHRLLQWEEATCQLDMSLRHVVQQHFCDRFQIVQLVLPVSDSEIRDLEHNTTTINCSAAQLIRIPPHANPNVVLMLQYLQN